MKMVALALHTWRTEAVTPKAGKLSNPIWGNYLIITLHKCSARAYLDDGHARDDRGGVLDGGAVDRVVGADDQSHIGVLELGIDLRTRAMEACRQRYQ
jgi:hypothetical protein